MLNAPVQQNASSVIPKECLSVVEPAQRPRNTLNCLLKRRGDKQIDVFKQRNNCNCNRCESREWAHAAVTFPFSVCTIMTSTRGAEQTRLFLNVLIWAFFFFFFLFSAGIYMTHSSCTKYSFIHRQQSNNNTLNLWNLATVCREAHCRNINS